jgi:hypothetical protein
MPRKHLDQLLVLFCTILAALAATGVLPHVLKVPHAPGKFSLPPNKKNALCAQKLDLGSLFSKIPSVTRDRFENILKFWAL